MQKLSYSNELMYAYVPSNKVGNIVSAITTDSLWAASEKHSDAYKFAVGENGFSRKTGDSNYRHWVVSICPANYGTKINGPYDGETFISRDGMVQIMDSVLVVKNSPGNNWHIVLFFPRSSWDK